MVSRPAMTADNDKSCRVVFLLVVSVFLQELPPGRKYFHVYRPTATISA